jgi:hypothetical protein
MVYSYILTIRPDNCNGYFTTSWRYSLTTVTDTLLHPRMSYSIAESCLKYSMTYTTADSCLKYCTTYIVAVYAVKNSWWWTEELPETCRISFQEYIWEISVSSWFYYKNLLLTFRSELNQLKYHICFDVLASYMNMYFQLESLYVYQQVCHMNKPAQWVHIFWTHCSTKIQAQEIPELLPFKFLPINHKLSHETEHVATYFKLKVCLSESNSYHAYELVANATDISRTVITSSSTKDNGCNFVNWKPRTWIENAQWRLQNYAFLLILR